MNCRRDTRGSAAFSLDRYTGGGLGMMLRRLFLSAGVRTARGDPPRFHDLRFTFAIQALSRLYRTGTDVQAKPPRLKRGRDAIQRCRG
jgi:hypothetical protein